MKWPSGATCARAAAEAVATTALMLALMALLPGAGTAQGSPDRAPNLSSGGSPRSGAAQLNALRRPDTVVVSIRDARFQTEKVLIEVGDVVVWRNADPIDHTITADSGSFGSPVIGTGKEWSFRFTKAGTYAYHCVPHPFMKAEIQVRQEKPE